MEDVMMALGGVALVSMVLDWTWRLLVLLLLARISWHARQTWTLAEKARKAPGGA